MTFSDIGLDNSLQKAIADLGFEEPTPIQAGVIPELLAGHDVLGQAQTGTGKTALAADFSRNYKRAAWFSVESAENDWDVFFRYFLESFSRILNKKQKRQVLSEIKKNKSQTVAQYIENLLTRVELPAEEKPFLIVIDGIHNVFDAGWFSEFFTTLLYALTPDTHLVLLSRSNPPLPLWRLRSKQVLGMIDEKLLAFTLEETEELFEKFDLPAEKAAQAFGKTFGRISRLEEFIGRLKQ